MEERSYKRANGSEATYKVSKGGSNNDKMSENLDATIKTWLDEGCTEVTEDELRNVKLSNIVRYITKDGKARRGGNLIKVEADYFRLLNPILGSSWSVQFKNTDKMFTRPIKGKRFFEGKEASDTTTTKKTYKKTSKK